MISGSRFSLPSGKVAIEYPVERVGSSRSFGSNRFQRKTQKVLLAAPSDVETGVVPDGSTA